MRISPLLLIALLSLSSFQAKATPPVELPNSMAALGDSITAAAIAGMNRTDGENSLLFPKFFWAMIKFGYKNSLAAFEDRKLSWATGWDKSISSHSQKLELLLKSQQNAPLQFFNAAVSGDTSGGLAAQTQNILKWSHETLSTDSPDYIVLEIGANDLCTDTAEQMTSTEAYLQNIQSSLEILLEKNTQSHILIGSAPNLEHLREIALNSPIQGLPFIKQCQDMWNTHGFCKDVLQESDPAKRALVAERLQNYLQGLEALTSELNTKWGQDRVRFSSDVYAYNFLDTDISVDCFHPNLAGQQVISDLMWQHSWWEK